MNPFAAKLLGIMDPVALMLLLIPIVASDALLSGVYMVISIAFFAVSRDHKELIFFAYGFVLMAIAEIFLARRALRHSTVPYSSLACRCGSRSFGDFRSSWCGAVLSRSTSC